MARHFYNILNRLATPLLHELPFFIIFFVLIGMRPFYNIYTYCVEPDLDTTPLDLAGRVAIVFTLGYVFTLLVDWIGKRWFKILAYAVVLAFFTVDLFLLRSFGMMLRPDVLMLLSETNGGEASEFVRLFLLTRGGEHQQFYVLNCLHFLFLLAYLLLGLLYSLFLPSFFKFLF